MGVFNEKRCKKSGAKPMQFGYTFSKGIVDKIESNTIVIGIVSLIT